MTRRTRTLIIATASALISVAIGCGGDDDGDAPESNFDREAELPQEPPPPPPAEETTIGQGIAMEERSWVRMEPDEGSRAIGVLRTGARFEATDRRDVNGQPWWKVRGTGWVSDAEVRVRDTEPTLNFIPRQPDLESGMPYPVGRVITSDGVDVYNTPIKAGRTPENFRVRRLQEGYFFTVDKTINMRDNGRYAITRYYRGPRYWWIPREGTTTVATPNFRGIEVTEETQIPFLWVTDPTARLCNQPQRPGGPAPSCQSVERHERLSYEETVQAGGQWYRTREGKFIASLQVARVDRIDRPDGIYANERWVHVDLLNQVAALYEGDQMVFVTLASSGDDEHATPTGLFRVESKHVTATMDNEDNMSSAYFIQDVPWVVYFRGSYALHGAFWHDRFGLRTSHGCVNLAPEDARRFFYFVDAPALIDGFHSVFTPPGTRSTAVYLTRGDDHG